MPESSETMRRQSLTRHVVSRGATRYLTGYRVKAQYDDGGYDDGLNSQSMRLHCPVTVISLFSGVIPTSPGE